MIIFCKKLILTFRPPGLEGVRGVPGQNIFYHVAASVIPFNLICNMTMFRKNWILTFWSHQSTQGVCHRSQIQNHVWHVSYLLYLCLQLLPCCCIRDSFDVQHDHVLKSWILTFWGERGAAGKIFATMLLHSRFPLIWYATWSCSAKVKFDLLTLGSGGGGGGLLAKYLLPCYCICDCL